MAISASMVKELREKTGAGMMDCKKALTNTDGDMDKAVEWLRENGLAKAEKKAGRIAAEGIVKTNISEDGKKAAIVEVNSETDFVAKNEKFQDFVAAVADQVNASSAADIDAFLAKVPSNIVVVIDDQIYVVFMAKLQQFFCLLLKIRFRKFLFPQLHQSHAAF